jgi:hypothetical protein
MNFSNSPAKMVASYVHICTMTQSAPGHELSLSVMQQGQLLLSPFSGQNLLFKLFSENEDPFAENGFNK